MSDISMRELAEILGVSVASVSVALRGRSGISEETRARILEEAQKRGYDMSRLSSPQSKGLIEIVDLSYEKIGVTVDRNPYYALLLEGITSRVAEEGYEIGGPYGPNDPGFSTRPKASGAILIGSMITDQELKQWNDGMIPFVVSGNPMTNIPVNSVSHDNIGGITSAVDHLVSLGHERIGYIRLMGGNIGAERQNAFGHALARHGLSLAYLWNLQEEYSPLRLPELTYINTLYDNDHDSATAVICDSDMLALLMMRVLRDHGSVPGRDVSVIGYDDTSMAALVEPPLTSIRTFESELGSAAAELLVSCIAKPNVKYRHVYVGTELIARASTAPLTKKK